MKNFHILGIHWKIQFLEGEITKDWYRGGQGRQWGVGGCLKRGHGQFADLRGAWQERQDAAFEGTGTPMDTMIWVSHGSVKLHISHQRKPYSNAKTIQVLIHICFSVFEELGQIGEIRPKHSKSCISICRKSSKVFNPGFHIKWSLIQV